MIPKTLFALALFALALFPLTSAADPRAVWPQVVFDSGCTDDFDAPATGTPARAQSSGSADGLCDGDTRVLTGPYTVDTDSTEIVSPVGTRGALLMYQSGTVTGTWQLCARVRAPWDASKDMGMACVDEKDGSHSGYTFIGLIGAPTSLMDAGAPGAFLPPRFYLELDLKTATSWTGTAGIIYLK